jgi:hypothetical protein
MGKQHSTLSGSTTTVTSKANATAPAFSRRRPRPGIVRRIEIHEDQQYRWWWALYDGERVAVNGPHDTKRDAKRDAHTHEPHVHVATIPWKLP